MPSLDDTLLYATGGALLGTGVYLYMNHYLDDLIPGGTNVGGTPHPQPQPQPAPNPNPTPSPGTSGTYTYWAKRKVQCRDNHLTFSYLINYGIRVYNWKLYNDQRIYSAMCGGPGPLTILVAIDSADAGSAAKLSSLGFTQYFAPPSDPNPSVPIPNPPVGSNYAMTMSYVGQSSNHKAYKVNRHYNNHPKRDITYGR